MSVSMSESDYIGVRQWASTAFSSAGMGVDGPAGGVKLQMLPRHAETGGMTTSYPRRDSAASILVCRDISSA